MNNPESSSRNSRYYDRSGLSTPSFTPSSSVSSKNLLVEQIKQRDINHINRTIQEEEEDNKPNIFILRVASRPDHEFSIEENDSLTIYEFKKLAFTDDELESKNIRLILKGRILKEEEKIRDLKLEKSTVMHGFISEKVEKGVNTLKTHQTCHQQQDQGLGIYNIRGFDSFKDYGIGESEIAIQRVNFHSIRCFGYEDYHLDQMSMQQLEEEWIAKHIERISDDPYFFPNCDFSLEEFEEENDEEGNFGKNLLDFVIGFILGYILLLLPILPKLLYYKRKLSNKGIFDDSVIIGFIMKAIMMTFRFYFFEDLWIGCNSLFCY